MSASAVQPLLAVRGVTLQYKTRDHLVTATYRVDFDVFRSDRFVILGPSGCGKSTLLKAVGGYMPPVEGKMELNGQEIRKPGPDRVMVFQEFDQLGMVPVGNTPDAFAAAIKEESARWAKVIRSRKLQVE